MARPKTTIPTPAETRALRFLHEHGSATVREYLEKGDHPNAPAYTSVMSLLSVMYDKGLATRTGEKRAYRYKPTLTQAELRTAVVANVLDNVFDGDLNALKAVVAAAKPSKKK